MTQLLVVILVCSAALKPDECTRDTANSIEFRQATMPIECAMAGFNAGVGLAVHRDDGVYQKTTCQRRKG